jgi:penicillin-binding protein 1A
MLAGALFLALVASACAVRPLEDPGIGELSLTTTVYAADGSVLATLHAEQNRVLVTYDQLPRYLIDAVVAIEDERYWEHKGVDLQAVARALVANVEEGDVIQGGSTITQQYLKNVLLTPEVTVDRKLTEAALAVRLEAGLTKEQILENYLNTVYFGNGAYGVGAAAQIYFGVDVEDLSVSQAALLAGFIQRPSATDPYQNPDRAASRRRVVLEKMTELGWLGAEEAAAADEEPISLAPPLPPEHVRFPYFTEEVKRRLLDDPALGLTATDRYNALFRGGLQVYTTLDPLLQTAAEEALRAVIPEDGPAAALASIEPRTGHVRALVGGRDFYDPDDPNAQFNLATQARRQPGSSFKPFTLAAAIEAGHRLNAVFAGGSNVEIQTSSGPWYVENYNGLNFGDLTLLEATVFSVNVIYARLVDIVGPEAVAELAAAAGITSDLQPFHSIALGAQEVSPLDMASAYGTFAADGVHIEPILVTHIDTNDGVNIYDATPIVTEAMDREVARGVTSALTEVVDRGTGQQAAIGRPVAGKTGTSQAHHDAWFVGYTPELATSVWVGYADGQFSMEPPATPFTVTGGTWPAQVWSRFTSVALNDSFALLQTNGPNDLISVDIDTSTGFLAGPLCPSSSVARVQLPADAVPTVVCPIHNPQGVVGIGAGEVPSVIGLDLSGAVSELTAHGYDATVEWQDGGQLAQGTVFNQSPSAGFPAQSGSPVSLIVAGPAPGSVLPSLLGFQIDHAFSELEEFGFTVDVRVEAESDPEDAARRSGMVWKQDPAPGTTPTGPVVLWANP